MVEPLNDGQQVAFAGHPAADRVTGIAMVVEQSRQVVGVSTWLADAAVTATTSGRLLQVLTPPDTRITYPLELMFGDGGGQWVVRGEPGGPAARDGFTGVPLAWDGERFAAVDGPIPAPDTTRDPATGSLEVQITTIHPATSELQLGATAEAVSRALTGQAPTGWGTAEPATQPWSARELTALCRERAPEPTALVVVGGRPGAGMVGRLRVSRVSTGVLEELRVAGPVATAVAQEAIDELVEDVAATARSMVVAVHPIRSEGLRPSVPSPPALPYGMLIGPSVVTQRGVDHARKAPAAAVRVLGRRSDLPACWCRLSGGPAAPFEQLDAVLRHFEVLEPLR